MKPAFTFTLPAKLLLTTVILLKCSAVFAQNARFAFDRTGSLLIQTNDAISPPEIVGGPRSQIVAPGRTASFAVVAADTRNLTYQWRFNGTNVPAATGDTLLLTNVSAASEGLYSVVLVNSSGSVTSAPAMLWLDGDGDGLPDAWEQTYFGNLTRNSTGDFDGDGISNLDEFNDGTSPTNNASAQFRLTVMNNGGQVSVTPAKLSYTNGELVTVAVTAFPGETFHIWSGSVVTRTNPVTLVMTNNKTLFAHFSPIPFTWTNTASGDWHNPTNWSYHLVPTALDNAVLPNNVTVTADAPADCHGLTLTAGTLTGTSNITLHGDSVWTGGTISGSGRTIIAPGATFTINSAGFNLALGRSLENGGTVVWTGNPTLNLANGVITNRAGALFHVQNAVTFGNGVGAPRFDNAGTFRKSSNSGTTTFNLPFNNYGVLDLQIGTLHHSDSFLNNGSVAVAAGATQRMAGGGSSSGTFTNPPTGLVEWTGGTFTLNTGAQLNGDGLYRINNVLTCNTDAVVQQLDFNGTLNGSGVVTISNVMTWAGGTISGSGRTIIAPGATFTISSAGFNLSLDRSLENGGTVVWTGNPTLNLANGVITNRAGALFHVQNATTLSAGVGAPRFDNAGTFRKSANPGTATFYIPLNNYGVLDLQIGTLHHSGSFLNNGSVAVAAGATQRMAGGGSASGTFMNPPTGLVEWTGGAFTLNTGAQLNGDGQYRINGGALTCNTDAAVQLLDLSGTLNGTGVVTISNAMSWTGGTMGGSGRTFIAPGATLTINSPFFTMALNRTLENAGTVVWPGAPGLNVNNVVITNRLGALFHVQNAATLSSGGGSPRFDNAGTFRKSANPGTATFNIPLNNYGDLDIQTGTLHHSGSFLNNGSVAVAAGTTQRMAGGGSGSGTFTNSPTGLVEWTGGTFTLNPGVQLNGAGLYRISGALACNTDTTVQNLDLPSGTLDGSGVVTISNAMTWTGGSLIGSGRTIIAPGATLTINNPFFTINLNRTLENGGTVLWTGAAVYVNNVAITNRVGALFHVQTAPTFYNNGGTPRFDNAGTFRKSVNIGTATFNIPLTNYGTMDIRSGILAANGGYVSSANALINCVLGGITPGVGYGQLQVAGSVALTGNLSVTLTNNFIPPVNSLYTVLTAGSRSGSFASFFYPTNDADMVMSNTPSSVVVRVLGPYFATTTLPDAMRNVGYTQQVTAVMNSNPIVYSVIAGALPAGLSFSSGGLISGIPTIFGNSIFTIQASDAAGVMIQQAFNLRVRNLPPEGLISWWRAENNALDSISTNHGVLTNGATFATGNVGQVFALDGVNDYVHVPDSPNLRPSSITLEAWAMFNSLNGPVFAKPLGPATGDSFALYLLSGTLHGFIHDASVAGVLVSSPSTLSLGQWHHVAFSFDDSTKQQALYVNGVRVATSQSNRSIGYDNKPVLLGQDINNGNFDFPLNGRIDEAAIYNRALSSNEIAAIFSAGSAGKPMNAPYFVTSAQLPDAVHMVGYTQQVSAVLGTSPITFSTPSNGLPAGLSLSSTGTISGIPLVAGTHSFILRATDSLDAFTDQQTTLRVIAPVTAPSGLISWWRGEGNAFDSAGTNHGTASNGVVFVEGKVGQAFLFDGVNDYVNVPDATNLRPASITLEAWAKFNGTQGPVLGRSWGSGTHNSYVIWRLSGNINGTIGDTNQAADILSAPFAPVSGQWYHVAFTFDDATKQQALYLNGAVVASGQSFRTIGYDNHPVVIGGDIDNGTVSFLLNGGVDEAAIYNRALTASEIAAIHNAGIAGKQLLSVIPPPVLHIEQISPSQVRLYWATNYSGYHLEHTASLNATNWSPSTPAPVITSTNYVVTNTISGPAKFYRLSSLSAPITPPAPTLKIERASSTNIRLLWPTTDPPFRLQSNTNLSTPTWITASPQPVTLGTNYVVTNAISGTQQCYRLINP